MIPRSAARHRAPSPSRRAFLAGALAAGGLAVVGGKLLGDAGAARRVTPTPVDGPTPSRWEAPLSGINVRDVETYNARLATLGRIGIARVYHQQMLPAKWTWAESGLSDSRRSHVSFKAAPASVSAGEHDETIKSWLSSIPSGWSVWLTLWHEPADELRSGQFTATDFRAAWHRLSHLVRKESSLQPDVNIFLVPVFGRYLLDDPSWNDAWVPMPEEVDWLSWDVFGNPVGGEGLDGPYPDVHALLQPCLSVTDRLGFRRWGITEFNTTRRAWDPSETYRVRWLEEFRSYCCTSKREEFPQLGSPENFLLWEGVGTGWDLRFDGTASVDWWRKTLAKTR